MTNPILLSPPCRSRGSALVLTFWLIAIMGLVVVGALQFALVDSRAVTAQRGLAQARRMAERALAVGAHPEIQRWDSALRQEGELESYRALITADEGRMNPNTLIEGKQSIVLNRLFLLWGMKPAEAIALTGAMTDWVDTDDLVALNGAEAKAYATAGRAGLPLNRPFQSFEEMRLVIGMDQLESLRPDWRDFFTFWSEGKINLNEAAPEVMAAATGVQLKAARRVFQSLAGRDGQRYTKDDIRFATVAEALQRLGIYTPAPPHLGIDGNTRRVEAIGTSGSFQCKLVMVLRGTEAVYRQEHPMSNESNVDRK